MVKLLPDEIQTKDILEWKGIHLLHAAMSSCSQKTRIFLNLKGIDWVSHLIDIGAGENHQPWFLGITSRGLVPVLVDDGDVHIESNDILLYLENKFQQPSLLPKDADTVAKKWLHLEDAMHMDLRALTFRYVIPKKHSYVKNPNSLKRLASRQSTLGGEVDKQKDVEIAFWETANKNDGITDAQVKAATVKFVDVFYRLDSILQSNNYILGSSISVVDIAWFIYANRLVVAGYPLSLHPNLANWFIKLKNDDAFAREITAPSAFADVVANKQKELASNGDTLEKFVNEIIGD